MAGFDALLSSKNTGIDFVIELVARLSWDQALPNMNHRTTLGFVQAMLEESGAVAPWTDETGSAFKPSTQEWMRRSKAIMGERDMWLEGDDAWVEVRSKHFNATRTWLASEAQSGSLTNTGPHLLRNFLSCSDNAG